MVLHPDNPASPEDIEKGYQLLFANFRKHIALSTEEEAVLRKLFVHRFFKKKNFVLKEGDRCISEFFIFSGCLRTYCVDNNGFEHSLLFAIESWWSGDIHSFITKKKAWINIVALEPTHLLAISHKDFDELSVRVPATERYFRILLQNSLVASQERMYQNLALTAEERYVNFRAKYPFFEQRIPQKHIASFLGITPEFLSTIRKKLSKKKN